MLLMLEIIMFLLGRVVESVFYMFHSTSRTQVKTWVLNCLSLLPLSAARLSYMISSLCRVLFLPSNRRFFFLLPPPRMLILWAVLSSSCSLMLTLPYLASIPTSMLARRGEKNNNNEWESKNWQRSLNTTTSERVKVECFFFSFGVIQFFSLHFTTG